MESPVNFQDGTGNHEEQKVNTRMVALEEYDTISKAIPKHGKLLTELSENCRRLKFQFVPDRSRSKFNADVTTKLTALATMDERLDVQALKVSGINNKVLRRIWLRE
jgi:hypothetical protein